MNSTGIEHLPVIWDDARDVPFFRITASLFNPDFCFGASGLLASYDETLDTAQLKSSEISSSPTTPAGVGDEHYALGDLIPVRVHRTR